VVKSWVAEGGCLVSEGLPGYYGNLGRIGTSQPNHGLDELFGVKQQDIQLTPDLLEELDITMEEGYRVRGGVYLQSYTPTTAKSVGRFEDGRIAAVDNTFGKGRTRLIGTFPGYGYARRQNNDMNRFFAGIPAWAAVEANVRSTDNRVIARLQKSNAAIYLWLVNSLREPIKIRVTLSDNWGPYQHAAPIRGHGQKADLQGSRTIATVIPARDVVIISLT